jgi:flavin reductase (DIM6/NTAB) family NADH-FMN oxidoreductase RutF
MPGATFTVNVLEANQSEMIAHFGKGFTLGQPAFEGLEIERPGGTPPVLSEALAYLECRVTGRCSAGDHELIVGEVVNGRVLNEGQPMVHVRKSGMHY